MRSQDKRRSREHAERVGLQIGLLSHSRVENYAVYIVVALTVASLILRVYRVDFLSLWVDEYIHAIRAEGVLKGKSLFGDDNNGIFLTLLIVPSYLIFGVNELASRFPSVLLGTLVTPLLYLFGKMLFNRTVGLLAALLNTVSVYSIFWSRMARNYASFEFFYLLLVIVFYLLLERSATRGQETLDRERRGWLARNEISPKYLALTPIALILSILNHQLTFFFVFSALCYGSIVAGVHVAKRQKNRFGDKYAALLYPAVAVVMLFYVPFFSDLVRPVLGLFLPEWVASWVIPRWDVVGAAWNSSDRYTIFNMYFDVLKNDFGNFWYIGILGIAASVYLDWKKGAFLASMFVVPFLLMSFVFRDPATPRYLLYVYPVFLLSIAIGLSVVLAYVARQMLSSFPRIRSHSQKAALATALVLLLVFAPWSETIALLTTEKHGEVLKRELTSWYFSNWREAYEYVRPRVENDDVIMSTFSASANFYLGRENTIWFRQRHFDSKKLDYVSNEATGNRGQSAWTYEEFLETVKLHNRGWIVADGYLYNVMTDPRAREYIFRTMKYHFSASTDGTVYVFSWDHSVPESSKAFVLELGKLENLSPFVPFTIKTSEAVPSVAVSIDCEGIDSDREAYLVVNRVRSTYLPRCKRNGRDTVTVILEKDWLVGTQDFLQFGYNPAVGQDDLQRGFVVYSIVGGAEPRSP